MIVNIQRRFEKRGNNLLSNPNSFFIRTEPSDILDEIQDRDDIEK